MLMSLLKASPLAPYLAALRIGAAVVAAGAVFVGGWTVNGWRWEARQAALMRSYDEAKDAAVADAEARRAKVAAAYAALDAQHYKELTDAQADNDRLRAAVAAGRNRLLVRAVCPTAPAMPGASAAPGLGDAGTAVLDPAARPDYFALRSNILMTENKLAACQDFFRKVTQ